MMVIKHVSFSLIWSLYMSLNLETVSLCAFINSNLARYEQQAFQSMLVPESFPSGELCCVFTSHFWRCLASALFLCITTICDVHNNERDEELLKMNQHQYVSVDATVRVQQVNIPDPISEYAAAPFFWDLWSMLVYNIYFLFITATWSFSFCNIWLEIWPVYVNIWSRLNVLWCLGPPSRTCSAWACSDPDPTSDVPSLF